MPTFPGKSLEFPASHRYEESMGLLFKNDFHDEFGTWALAYISAGGLEYGEILAVAEAVGDGDDSAFYEAWVAAGDRLHVTAEQAIAAGHRATARAFFLRAACAYSAANHPIYGRPVDPRLVVAFRKQIAAFERGLALGDPAVQPQRIPYEATSLPAYFIPAEGRAHETRPLLILTNGYDGSVTDLYFASAVAASRRGYHCLLFDGPGQGELLIEQGIPLRSDWENVIRPVVDFALTLPHVDPARIALSGWSLGGYLAPRAASGEPRLAACIADPGLWSVATGFRGFVLKMGGTPEMAAHLAALDPAMIEAMSQIVQSDRRLRWVIEQRGFWVNGVNNLREYLQSAETFTMEGRAGLIQCPTLFTMPENDPRAAEARAFYDQVTCPKTLLTFTAAEGADGHCEMKNRSFLNLRVLDWLDDVLASKA